MNEDRELLELAAFAAGHKINKLMQGERDAIGAGDVGLWIDGISTCWNPISDDGHALRLAVRLNMELLVTDEWVFAIGDFGPNSEPRGSCPFAATRRAIVRAAAEIGKDMKEQDK